MSVREQVIGGCFIMTENTLSSIANRLEIIELTAKYAIDSILTSSIF
jgi:hypothetical protein